MMSKKYWKLTDEEYEYIKGEVCHIFEQYKVKCIPVSGFEIAAKMGITLIAYSGLSQKKLKTAMETSKDGFFIETDGKEYIYYNDIDGNYERQNWTILHEVGHIALDHCGRSEHEEDEADFFAKYAIAPPVLVHKIGVKSELDIYLTFDISFEASVYAWDYYCSWKKRYDQLQRLQDYELRLLALSENNA